MPPVINEEICSGCGICVDICSSDVFYGYQKGEVPLVSYAEECWHCNACVLDCPFEGAVTLRVPLPASLLYK